MTTSISDSGVLFNKVTTKLSTVGIRNDGIQNKLYGIRPLGSDNHNQQFEVTFNKFVNDDIEITGNNIYSNLTINDNDVQTSDNTKIYFNNNAVKHCIDIENITNELFIAEYKFNYIGYELDIKKQKINNNHIVVDRIKIYDNYDDMDNDESLGVPQMKLWIENNRIRCIEEDLEKELNELYPADANTLRNELTILENDITMEYFSNLIGITDYDNLYFVPGIIELTSNNFFINKMRILNPRFMDNEYNENKIYGQHIIHIDEINNEIKYYKLPSTKTIMLKLMNRYKWLDAYSSSVGAYTFTSGPTELSSLSTISNTLCIISSDYTSYDGTNSLVCDSNGSVIIGVNGSSSTTIPDNYPYFAYYLDTGTYYCNLIEDSSDQTAIETAAGSNDLNYYELTNRTITMTNPDSLIDDTSNTKSLLLAYFTLNISNSGSIINDNSLDNNHGFITKRLECTSTTPSYIYQVHLELYANIYYDSTAADANMNDSKFGMFVSLFYYSNLKYCTVNFKGMLDTTGYTYNDGSTFIKLSFFIGNITNSTIDNITVTANSSTEDTTSYLFNLSDCKFDILSHQCEYSTITNIDITANGEILPYFSSVNTYSSCGISYVYSCIIDTFNQTLNIKFDNSSNSSAGLQRFGLLFGYTVYCGSPDDSLDINDSYYITNINSSYDLYIYGALAKTGLIIGACALTYIDNLDITINKNSYVRMQNGYNSPLFSGYTGDSNRYKIKDSQVKFYGDLYLNTQSGIWGSIMDAFYFENFNYYLEGTIYLGGFTGIVSRDVFNQWTTNHSTFNTFKNVFFMINSDVSYHDNSGLRLFHRNNQTSSPSINFDNTYFILNFLTDQTYTSLTEYATNWNNISCTNFLIMYTGFTTNTTGNLSYLSDNTYTGSVDFSSTYIFTSSYITSEGIIPYDSTDAETDFTFTSVNRFVKLYPSNTSSNVLLEPSSSQLQTIVEQWPYFSSFDVYPTICINGYVYCYEIDGSTRTSGHTYSSSNWIQQSYVPNSSGTQTLFVDNLILENGTIDTTYGSIDSVTTNIDNNIYVYLTLTDYYKPSDLISNLSTLKGYIDDISGTFYLNYIPYSIYATNSAINFRVYELSDIGSSITTNPSLSSTGYYFVDASGTLTFGNRTITFDGSSITVDSKDVGTNKNVSVIFSSDVTTLTYYSLALGSLELTESDLNNASTSGDPHIYTMNGECFELPNKVSFYRMLQGNKLRMNLSTRKITELEQEDIREYYRRVVNENIPSNLVTDGIFYDKLYLNSENNVLILDFDNKTADIYSNDYFKIVNDIDKVNVFEQSKMIEQTQIIFNHSNYGEIILTISYFDNPQIKYGIGLKMAKSNCTGLLEKEYLTNTMELNNLFDLNLINGVVGKNPSNSEFIMFG